MDERLIAILAVLVALLGPSVVSRILALLRRKQSSPSPVTNVTNPINSTLLTLTRCQAALLKLADSRINLDAFRRQFKTFESGYFSTNAFTINDPQPQYKVGDVLTLTSTLSTAVKRLAGSGLVYLNVQSTIPFAQFGTLDRWTINLPVRAIYTMDQDAYKITNEGGLPGVGKGNGLVRIQGSDWTTTASLSLNGNLSTYAQKTQGTAGVRLSLTGDAKTGLEWNTPTETTEQLHQAFMIGANKYYNPIIRFSVNIATHSFGTVYAFVLMHRGQLPPTNTSNSEWWLVKIDADKSTISFFDCRSITSNPFATIASKTPVAVFNVERGCTYKCAIQLQSDGRVAQLFESEQVWISDEPTVNDTIINVQCATGFISNAPCALNIGSMILAQNQIMAGKEINQVDTFYAQPQANQLGSQSFTIRVMQIGGDSIKDDKTLFGPIVKTFQVQ